MIKIFCTYKPIEKPWGGANNFIRALYHQLSFDGRFKLVESIDDSFDILFMNQFSLGPVNQSKKIKIKEIKSIINNRKPQPKIVVRAINLTMHAYPPKFRGILPALIQDRDTINLLNFADYVIFQSNYQYSFFKKAGFSNQKYSIIHNGADTNFICNVERPELKKNNLYLVSSTIASRKTKRHDLIARFSEFPGVHVLHIGVWPKKIPLKNVILKGLLEREAMKALYQQGHYFLHPAIKDPCPNVIFEALSAGLPVIYNPDKGSSPEIVGKCGIPIDEKNLESTINKAYSLFPTIVKEVKNNKYYFSINRAANEYISVFLGIV